MLRFRNVGLGLEKNTEDSRDNRHDRYDFSSFSKVVNEKTAEMFYESTTRDKSMLTNLN